MAGEPREEEYQAQAALLREAEGHGLTVGTAICGYHSCSSQSMAQACSRLFGVSGADQRAVMAKDGVYLVRAQSGAPLAPLVTEIMFAIITMILDFLLKA